MLRKLAIVALAGGLTAAFPGYGMCQVPVTDMAVNAQQIKDAAVTAKNWVVEARGWVDVGNSYLEAVKNTAQLPLNVINQAQSLYYRTQAFGRSVDAFFDSGSPMMQRLAMAQSLGTRGAGIPGSAVRNAEWWQQRAEAQWEDNRTLLGLDQQRQEINSGMLELSASAGDSAYGALQALQSQNKIAVAAATELQSINSKLEQQFVYQMEKDAGEEIKKQAIRDFMAVQRDYQEKAW